MEYVTHRPTDAFSISLSFRTERIIKAKNRDYPGF
jgi:hypothetical protein